MEHREHLENYLDPTDFQHALSTDYFPILQTALFWMNHPNNESIDLVLQQTSSQHRSNSRTPRKHNNDELAPWPSYEGSTINPTSYIVRLEILESLSLVELSS
jgi:hypothetical protein